MSDRLDGGLRSSYTLLGITKSGLVASSQEMHARYSPVLITRCARSCTLMSSSVTLDPSRNVSGNLTLPPFVAHAHQ